MYDFGKNGVFGNAYTSSVHGVNSEVTLDSMYTAMEEVLMMGSILPPMRIHVLPMPKRTVQNKQHRKKRINKKWLKLHGIHREDAPLFDPDTLIYNKVTGEVTGYKQAIDGLIATLKPMKQDRFRFSDPMAFG